MRTVTAILLLPAALFGCASPKGKGLLDEDASFKIPAIKAAAEHKNKSAEPQLVTDLRSTDPAVRFYAIEALRRLTGEDFGYRYFDDETDRAPAIARWQDWLANRKP